MIKKKSTKPGIPINPELISSWRKLLSDSIPLQIDLDKGQLSASEKTGIEQMLHFDAKDLARVINDYIDPSDVEHVLHSLQQARKGHEEPITFNFIHPQSARKHSFEYRYEIVYVKYASTCLKGSLRKLAPKPANI